MFCSADVIGKGALPTLATATVRTAFLALASCSATSVVVQANMVFRARSTLAAATIIAAGLAGAVWLADAQPVDANVLLTCAPAAADCAATVVAALSVFARINGRAAGAVEADVSLRAGAIVGALLDTQRAVHFPGARPAGLTRAGKMAIRICLALDRDIAKGATLGGVVVHGQVVANLLISNRAFCRVSGSFHCDVSTATQAQKNHHERHDNVRLHLPFSFC